MPFDVLIDKPVNLNDHLAMLGITPVPMETLTRHKAEQERLHRAHLLSTPWPLLGLYAVVSALIGCMMFPRFHSLVATALFTMAVGGLLTLVVVALVGTYITLMDITIYGKPTWVEFEAMAFHDPMMPPSIRAIIRDVRRNMPGYVVIGELRQKEVVLDPYVLIVQNGERACLGIWAGSEVIACAETI